MGAVEVGEDYLHTPSKRTAVVEVRVKGGLLTTDRTADTSLRDSLQQTWLYAAIYTPSLKTVQGAVF